MNIPTTTVMVFQRKRSNDLYNTQVAQITQWFFLFYLGFCTKPLEILIALTNYFALSRQRKDCHFWFITIRELVQMNTCNFYPGGEDFGEDDK